MISSVIVAVIFSSLCGNIFSQPLTDAELKKIAVKLNNYSVISNQNNWLRVANTNYKHLAIIQEKKIKSLERSWLERLWDDIDEWVYAILAVVVYERLK